MILLSAHHVIQWFVLELYKVADYENVVGGNSAPYYVRQ